MYEDAYRGRKKVGPRISNLNTVDLRNRYRYQAAGRFKYACLLLFAADPDSGLFSDILVRLISVGDMSSEPFAKPFIEHTAPPSAQKGYEPSMFTSHPQASESSDVCMA
jgi:hypothetical protein